MIYILIALGIIFVIAIIVLVVYLAKLLGESNGTFKNLKEYRTNMIGKSGENQVKKILEKIPGYLYSPCKIPNKEGKIREIDHVFVNKTGVYIIETKNWSGTITGSDEDQNWFQHIGYEEEQVNVMPNPIYQNEGHLLLMRAILPKEATLIPMVVMVQNNSSTINSEGVIDLKDLKDEITTAEEVMSEELVNKILKVINEKYINVPNDYIKNQNINEHVNK